MTDNGMPSEIVKEIENEKSNINPKKVAVKDRGGKIKFICTVDELQERSVSVTDIIVELP